MQDCLKIGRLEHVIIHIVEEYFCFQKNGFWREPLGSWCNGWKSIIHCMWVVFSISSMEENDKTDSTFKFFHVISHLLPVNVLRHRTKCWLRRECSAFVSPDRYVLFLHKKLYVCSNSVKYYDNMLLINYKNLSLFTLNLLR